MILAMLSTARMRLIAVISAAIAAGLGLGMAATLAGVGIGQFGGISNPLVVVAAMVGIVAIAGVAVVIYAMKRLMLRPLDRIGQAADLASRVNQTGGDEQPHSRSALGRVAQLCDNLVQQIGEHRRAAAVAEARAEQVRDNFADLTEATSDAITLYDEDDRLIQVNSRFFEFFPKLAGRVQPGKAFAEVCQIAAEVGQVSEARDRADAWVAERLKQRRYSDRSIELGTGERWLRMRAHDALGRHS